MAKKQNIELHNEEVREIMKEIPGSLIRWGLTFIFLIFISIIVGSYFFQFKEIVSAPIIITTSNPPAPIISKSTGRIGHWFISDGDEMKSGANIAVIKNLAVFEDLTKLESFITNIDSSRYTVDIQNWIPPNLIKLGELQDGYNQLLKNYNGYQDYVNNKFLLTKIDLLKQQILKQQQHYKLSLQQQKMMEEELNITRKTYKRNQQLLEKGGMSENQLEEARARVIQSERAYTSFLASLKTAEINMINQKRSLMELEEQYLKDLANFKQTIHGNLEDLKIGIKTWKDKYLLTSPVDGKITLTKYWSENHFISTGERIATVIPADSSNVICRALVPSSGIGKIENGQQVNIKLAGYPYMEHGMLTGSVNAISLVPEEQGYIVEIGLKEGMLSSYSEQLKLVQEMDGTAEIIADEMRMIYRFINPLKMLFEN